MADLARIARPWLTSMRKPIRTPMMASSRIGLGIGLGNHSRSISNKKMREGAFRREKQKDKITQAEVYSAFLLPFTIVPPPIWRFPLSPIKFVEMALLLGRNRVTAFGSLMGVYFMSMRTKGWINWPQFRARKRSSIPAAKALHVQMSQALAAGDKEALRGICTAEFFHTLAAPIDARPRGLRTEWELVRYEDRLRYPRLADFRVTYQPGTGSKGLRLVKQAVVSISSVQRLTRYYDDEDGRRVVPGSGRERHMTEHLVLQAVVKDSNFETGPWKLWGTLPEMSYETMRDDTAMFQEAMANNIRQR